MHTQTLTLLPSAPGITHQLTVHRFGREGAGPKALIQAALHADEVPALLVAQRLRQRLAQLEAEGALRGQVLLVPYANPAGLAQLVLGRHHGRFDLRDGLNFNRGFADLAPAAAKALAGRLGSNAEANVQLVRDALCGAAAALPAHTTVQDMKRRLLQLAADCSVVLDLHCDAESVLHLYALTPQADTAQQLAALIGAQAVLLATESGDGPFDEACTRPWHLLQQQFAEHPLPLDCFAATVELRGEADTDHALAAQDTEALLAFLQHRGVLAGTPPPLPAARCVPTPLAASEPIVAPHAGVVVFLRAPGDTIAAGETIADLVDVDSGAVTAVRAQSAGVLYARVGTRWATPGMPLAKVAGTTLLRTGNLLGA